MPARRTAIRLLTATLVALVALVGLGVPSASAAITYLCKATDYRCDSTGGYHGQSVWGYPLDSTGHNCTNYAAYRLAQTGMGNPGNLGNAQDWASNARAKGFGVDGNPALGSIAQYTHGSYYAPSYGHVAYVTEVGNGYVVVEEDNYSDTGNGYLDRRRINAGAADWPNNFINFHDVPTGDPRGSFDEVQSPGPGQVRVRGWAYDPSSPTSAIHVHVYVGGPAASGAPGFDIGNTGVSRADVHNAYPEAGYDTGFDATVNVSSGGNLPVYVYAINVGPGNNVLLGSKTVAVADPNPLGHLDVVESPNGGALHVRGWAYDPNDPRALIHVHVYVGGPAGSGAPGYDIGTTGVPRGDVQAAYPAAGPITGFDTVLRPIGAGSYAVYAYAINIGAGDNRGIGNLSADVATDSTAPVTGLAVGSVVTTTGTVSARFAASDAGSGATTMDVRYRRASTTAGFGSYAYPASWQGTSARSVAMRAAAGSTYCFSVRARDSAGNLSSWSTERCSTAPLDDRALTATSGWVRATGSVYLESTISRATEAGQRLSRTGVRARSLALIATTCSGCGSVAVYWNGHLVRTVNLASSSTHYRQVISLGTVSGSGSLLVKALGSARVYVDGLAALQA